MQLTAAQMAIAAVLEQEGSLHHCCTRLHGTRCTTALAPLAFHDGKGALRGHDAEHHARPPTLPLLQAPAFGCIEAVQRWWQEWRALAVACCTAAKVLHSKGLVHRDMRLPNVVQLEALQYMVIDLESAARVSDDALPGGFERRLRTCSPAALDQQRRFTTLSDMHCIGMLLQMPQLTLSEAAKAFIDSLLLKQLSAEEALEWLNAYPGAS